MLKNLITDASVQILFGWSNDGGLSVVDVTHWGEKPCIQSFDGEI